MDLKFKMAIIAGQNDVTRKISFSEHTKPYKGYVLYKSFIKD